MCLILFSYNQHPRYKLVVAANRDEFLERPAKPAGFWDEHPLLLAGKDVRGGGTWLGITKNLRFAALTNYRDPALEKSEAPTRGRLVLDFLNEDVAGHEYLEQLQKQGDQYNGFNLLVGDGDALWYYSNVENRVKEVGAGLHGLSNHLLNTPWPKVEKGKAGLNDVLQDAYAIDIEPASIISLMQNRQQAADAELPQTGISLEWERALSSMYIEMPNYGTRVSTALLVEHDGTVTFVEQTHPQGNATPDQVHYTFTGSVIR